MKTEHENLIDEFIGNIDFDNLLKWLDLMEIDNEPPPIDDMYPEWEGEKKTELMESLCNLFDFRLAAHQLALEAWQAFMDKLPRDFALQVDLWHLFTKAKELTIKALKKD